jgi:hypothetical protein
MTGGSVWVVAESDGAGSLVVGIWGTRGKTLEVENIDEFRETLEGDRTVGAVAVLASVGRRHRGAP